ncbi:hypothetical protein PUN28_011746 [Cardiocondyla obscurior]|uniref:Uncharacterized protein n=1 Tax=Cardiocondyla obscurior TaxID=286306 RepID=A0AAW2FJZ4_9HYME
MTRGYWALSRCSYASPTTRPPTPTWVHIKATSFRQQSLMRSRGSTAVDVEDESRLLREDLIEMPRGMFSREKLSNPARHQETHMELHLG